jgi:hypothetical protein
MSFQSKVTGCLSFSGSLIVFHFLSSFKTFSLSCVLCFELRADAVMGLLSSYLFFPSFHGPELFLLFGFS